CDVEMTYDQGQDTQLLATDATKNGACQALCWRWLKCAKNGVDFWGSTMKFNMAALDDFSGNASPWVVIPKKAVGMQKKMKSLEEEGREKAVEMCTLQMKKYGMKPKSPKTELQVWSAGPLERAGSALVDFVCAADQYLLVALTKGLVGTTDRA